MAKTAADAPANLAKPTITPKEALAIAQQTLGRAFKEAKANASREFASIESRVGGSTEQLDASVIEQGRRWAQRLTMIARRSAGTRHTPSKTSVAIQVEVKKIFAVIGSLEAIIANDVEIPLFAQISEQSFFGDDYIDIRKMKAADLEDIVRASAGVYKYGANKNVDAATLRSREFLDTLLGDIEPEKRQLVIDAIGDRLVDIPADEDEDEDVPTGKRKRRSGRVAAKPRAAADDPEDDEGDDE